MSTQVKPEPLSARINWNYDNYFLSRAGYLNVATRVVDDYSEPNPVATNNACSEKEVILQKMYLLAHSINLKLNIKIS